MHVAVVVVQLTEYSCNNLIVFLKLRVFIFNVRLQVAGLIAIDRTGFFPVSRVLFYLQRFTQWSESQRAGIYLSNIRVSSTSYVGSSTQRTNQT